MPSLSQSHARMNSFHFPIDRYIEPQFDLQHSGTDTARKGFNTNPYIANNNNTHSLASGHVVSAHNRLSTPCQRSTGFPFSNSGRPPAQGPGYEHSHRLVSLGEEVPPQVQPGSREYAPSGSRLISHSRPANQRQRLYFIAKFHYLFVRVQIHHAKSPAKIPI